MKESDRAKLAGAFAYALAAHAGQTRKGLPTPYASHLLQVSGLVLEAGGDVEQAAAGLLHDSLEDSDEVDVETLHARFGPGVTEIVVACSDLLPGDSAEQKSPWPERKTRFLLQISAAPPRAQLVCACDKLHNLRSLVADLRAYGVETLERFNATPGQTHWYYGSIHRALRDVLPEPLAAEFDAALAAFAEFVPEVDAPPDA